MRKEAASQSSVVTSCRFARLSVSRSLILILAALVLGAAPGCGGGGDEDGESVADAAPVTALASEAVSEAPTRNVFSLTPASGPAPLDVSVDASGMSMGSGFILGYTWDFGDGERVSAGPVSLAHRYTRPGTYTVTLVVSDDKLQAAAPVTRIVTVTSVDGNVAPTAAISASTTLGKAPLAVSFDASGSQDEDGRIAEFTWNFGDGASASGATAQHRYDTTGVFLARLRVTDDAGAAAEAARTIVVTDAQTTAPTLPETQRVSAYFIGNSHTDSLRFAQLATLATGQGKALTWGRHMIPGAPLEWIYNHPDNGFCDPSCYASALPGAAWDVVTIQPFVRDVANDADYGGRFLDLALRGNPDTQLYVYSIFPQLNWAPSFKPPYLSWEAQWLGDTGIVFSRAYYEAVAAGISVRHPGAKPVLIVPTGEVMYTIKKKIDAGLVPGMKDVWDFYIPNDGHLNKIGEYLLGTTFYATLHRADPRTLPVGDYGIDPAIARIIRESVYETLQAYPNDGVSF